MIQNAQTRFLNLKTIPKTNENTESLPKLKLPNQISRDIDMSIEILPKLINPGICNAEYPHCVAITYFQGKQIIAYGSSNNVVIASNVLSIITLLEGHSPKSKVTSVAWAPFSGRLSSAGSDGQIIIWEPNEKGWYYSLHLRINFIPICMSWSICDHVFCVSGSKFSIYTHKAKRSDVNKDFVASCVYSEDTPTTFCSHSPDSRFILSLPTNQKVVFIYYKISKKDYDYSRIILNHPSIVISARWRASEQLYERACFITVCKDYTVRIWDESGKDEPLSFSPIAAFPPKLHIIAASFIKIASKSVSNNPIISKNISNPHVDKYAYGHGHFIKRDNALRNSNVADPQELNRNRFWILTFNRSQKMTIWEVSGICSSVRRTPKISKILTQSVLLGIEPSSVNHIYAFCRLENEYSHFSKKDFVGRPSSLTLYLQNRVSKVFTSVDIVIRKKISVSQITHLHGHEEVIQTIRHNKDYPYILTIDSNHNMIIWAFNDTDVYDPSLLGKFITKIPTKVFAGDFLTSSDIIGYNGEKFIVIQIQKKMPPIFNSKYKSFDSPSLLPKETRIELRVLCGFCGGFIFYVQFSKDIFVMWIKHDTIEELFHSTSEEPYLDSCPIYITQLFPYAGAILFLASTKHVIYSFILNTTRNKGKVVSMFKSLELQDEICGACFTHPAYFFIACTNKIYFARRESSTSNELKIIQSIPIDFTPKEIRSNPNGMLSVIGNDRLELFHQFRDSKELNKSNLKWKFFAKYNKYNISSSEWTIDGILLYSVGRGLYAFTKYMDTFFIKSFKMMPTIHNTMAQYSQSICDFSPYTLIPMAISGRSNLILKMLEYLNKNYISRYNWFYQDFVLGASEESSKNFEGNYHELIEELKCKMEKNPMKKLSAEENNRMIHFLDCLPKIIEIHSDSLDAHSIVIARALALSSKHMIPFDLINAAYISHDQTNLVELIDFSDWNAILNSGIIFWLKDINILSNKLVQFAINIFDNNRSLAIFILVVTRKFFVLKSLFKKSGDELRSQFFLRDFTKDKEKRSAEKNGYSALNKHDFYTAIAMFFLADKTSLSNRIILQNLNDSRQSYMIARFYDSFNPSSKYLNEIIDEIFIPKSNECNDLAALEFFNRQKGLSQQFDFSNRFKSHIVGNIFSSSDFFCDTRFVVAEIFRTTNDQKTDFILSLLLSGNNFLATLFLSYFNTFELAEEEISFFKAGSSLTFENTESLEIGNDSYYPSYDDKLEEDTSESRENLMIQELNDFSFGYTGADAFISDYSDEFSDEESTNDSSHKDNNLPSLLNPSPSITLSHNDLMTDVHHYNEGTLYKLETNINKDKRLRKSLSKKNSESHFKSTGIKKSASTDLKIFHSMSSFSRDDSDVFDTASESESYEQFINWMMIVALFNVARLRLESFLATQFEFKNTTISLIYNKVKESGKHLSSMFQKFNDYLIRSCKRRGIVVRRLLLISSEMEKIKYLEALCSSMSHLPNQMLASKLTKQQITQISRNTQTLIRCINRQILQGLEYNPIFSYIISSIATAIFIIALSKQNIELMFELIQLNLSEVKSFPEKIENLLQVKFIEPGSTINKMKREESMAHNYFSLISIENSKEFVNNDNSNHNCLSQFSSSLIDFMVIDTLIKNIKKIKYKETKYFGVLLYNLQKLYDVFLQLFTYTAINFPEIRDFNTINEICNHKNRLINELVDFLVSYEDRNKIIFMFCTNLLDKFANNSNHTQHIVLTKNFLPKKQKLKKSKTRAKYKGPIHSMCINKDSTNMLIASSDGIKSISHDFIQRKEDEDENDTMTLIFDIDNEEEEEDSLEGNNSRNTNTKEASNTIPTSEISEENKTKNEFRINEVIIKSNTPICLKSSPTDNIAIIGENSGNVWMHSFNNKDKFDFLTPKNTRCNSIAISKMGTVFAASHNNEVRLWSLDQGSSMSNKSFRIINTYSERCTGIEFAEGTNFLMTSQIESLKFKGNLVFWDALIPSPNSMVASINIQKLYGEISSMSYTPRYSQVIVGTKQGKICVIDTRQFEIINAFQYGLKKNEEIEALSIDPNQLYYVTGTNSGTLSLWDLQTSVQISEIKHVHRPKYLQTNALHAISSIAIQNNVIYTGGFDGTIKSTKFCI